MEPLQTQRRSTIRRAREHGYGDGNTSDSSAASTVATADEEISKTHDCEEKVSKKKKIFRRIKRSQSRSATTQSRGRKNVLDNHFNVDRDSNARVVVLPGLPKHDDNFARDSHDFFNLVALIPIVVLNMMNWDWEKLTSEQTYTKVEEAWTGDWFDVFFQITVLYFIIDLAWVCVLPKSVNSPGTIIKHHIATLLYLTIPFRYPEYRWFMGACMSVEINTWFLIARRVFNKQGFPPWVVDLPFFISFRVKIISVFFYLTWFGTRCVLYPILWFEFYNIWKRLTEETGTIFNVFAIVLSLHTALVMLNFKWTYDLFMSKMRWWKKHKKNGGKEEISKGL